MYSSTPPGIWDYRAAPPRPALALLCTSFYFFVSAFLLLLHIFSYVVKQLPGFLWSWLFCYRAVFSFLAFHCLPVNQISYLYFSFKTSMFCFHPFLPGSFDLLPRPDPTVGILDMHRRLGFHPLGLTLWPLVLPVCSPAASFPSRRVPSG